LGGWCCCRLHTTQHALWCFKNCKQCCKVFFGTC